MTTQQFSINDRQIACHTSGEGTPLLLIHGFPFDHTMWQPQIEALSQVCQVIAPDLRGYGQSTMTDDDRDEGVDMATYATDLVEVLDQLELSEPVILCGFSMGGYILWQLARLIPDRIRAIIACDTRAAADSDEASDGRIKMAELVVQTGVEPVVEGLTPKLLASGTMEGRPELVEQVQSMIRTASPAAIASSQRGMSRRQDVENQLGTFDWPALVLAGTEDAISPADEMRGIAEALPQGQFVEIANAGHMTVLENPEAVNEALTKFVGSV